MKKTEFRTRNKAYNLRFTEQERTKIKETVSYIKEIENKGNSSDAVLFLVNFFNQHKNLLTN
jgi:hypothetical protein